MHEVFLQTKPLICGETIRHRLWQNLKFSQHNNNSVVLFRLDALFDLFIRTEIEVCGGTLRYKYLRHGISRFFRNMAGKAVYFLESHATPSEPHQEHIPWMMLFRPLMATNWTAVEAWGSDYRV